jgi:hypothetical protein
MTLPNIPEWLKMSSAHLAAIAIAAGMLLFSPSTFTEALGVARFVIGYRMWIGVVFLASTAVLLSRTGGGLFEFTRNRVRQNRTLKMWQRRLHELTSEEKRVLASYVLKGTRTQYFQLQDGVIQGLVAEKIIMRASTVGDLLTGIAYNIQPWAWEYLKEHPRLLSDDDERARLEPGRS